MASVLQFVVSFLLVSCGQSDNLGNKYLKPLIPPTHDEYSTPWVPPTHDKYSPLRPPTQDGNRNLNYGDHYETQKPDLLVPVSIESPFTTAFATAITALKKKTDLCWEKQKEQDDRITALENCCSHPPPTPIAQSCYLMFLLNSDKSAALFAPVTLAPGQRFFGYFYCPVCLNPGAAIAIRTRDAATNTFYNFPANGFPVPPPESPLYCGYWPDVPFVANDALPAIGGTVGVDFIAIDLLGTLRTVPFPSVGPPSPFSPFATKTAFLKADNDYPDYPAEMGFSLFPVPQFPYSAFLGSTEGTGFSNFTISQFPLRNFTKRMEFSKLPVPEIPYSRFRNAATLTAGEP